VALVSCMSSLKPRHWRGCVSTGKFITKPKRSPSSTASPKRTPPSRRKNTQSYLFPFLSFLYIISHISEYASVIFSFVESFAHKALVAYNCGLRFNGSIMQYVCKALSNLLSCCLMIWKLLFEKWCYVIVFIVIIVKTMFRFWPRSPSSLNQPRK